MDKATAELIALLRRVKVGQVGEGYLRQLILDAANAMEAQAALIDSLRDAANPPSPTVKPRRNT